MDLNDQKQLFAINKLQKLVPNLKFLRQDHELQSLPHNLVALRLNLNTTEFLICPLDYNLVKSHELIKNSNLQIVDLDSNLVLALYELALKPYLQKCNESFKEHNASLIIADYLSSSQLTTFIQEHPNLEVYHCHFTMPTQFQSFCTIDNYTLPALNDDFVLICPKATLVEIYDLLCEVEKQLTLTPNANSIDPLLEVQVKLDSFKLSYNEIIGLNVGDALVLKHFCNNDIFNLSCNNLQTTALYQDGLLNIQKPFALGSLAPEAPIKLEFNSLSELTSINLQDSNNFTSTLENTMQDNEISSNPEQETKADTAPANAQGNINLQDLELRVDCVLDSFKLPLSQITSLQAGSCLNLKQNALNDIKIYINDKFCASGKVIAINNQFALQITKIN